MRILLLSLIGYLIAGYLEAESASQDVSMNEFKWKNRIILMSAPSSADRDFIEQVNRLSGKEYEIRDRDLMIIRIFARGQSLIDQSVLSEESAASVKAQSGVTEERNDL